MADGGFHSQAGWLAFNAVALGLVVGTRRVRFFSQPGAVSLPPAGPNLTAAYLAPLFVGVATTMLTRAFSTGFDWLYPLPVLGVAAVLWFFRGAYAALRPTWTWYALAMGIAVFALWLAPEPVAGEGQWDEKQAETLASAPRGWVLAWLFFRVAGSVVTVPLAEELAFRGYLTRRLIAEKTIFMRRATDGVR